ATEQESFIPAEAVPADVVEATLRVEFRILVITASDLEDLAAAVLDAGLEPGYEPVAGEAGIEFLTPPEPDEAGAASWEMAVSRTVRAVPDPDSLVFAVLGKTPEAAARRVEASFPQAGPPEIVITPAWWPWLPLLPVQIEIEIAQGESG
ncbi:MAG TPA: hypothetical protein VMN57_00130, partial [Anaerolineales bacterium]|nr:hypothetical protein [Anaerolineales bacterium]